MLEFGRAARPGSRADQEILALRVDNSLSTVFLIDGVDRDHRAVDVLS